MVAILNRSPLEISVARRYEVFDYNCALDVLRGSYAKEFQEILTMLANLDIPLSAIKASGGSKSDIPKMVDDALFPLGWVEMRIEGDLLLHKSIRSQRSGVPVDVGDSVIEGFIDGHNIDFVKGRVAFDLEWNSKDQTFDRDLLAMRTYHEAGVIDVGIILTRSSALTHLLKKAGVGSKYGASTTWIGKLLPRLDSRRNGGCPILAIGILPEVIDMEK